MGGANNEREKIKKGEKEKKKKRKKRKKKKGRKGGRRIAGESRREKRLREITDAASQ